MPGEVPDAARVVRDVGVGGAVFGDVHGLAVAAVQLAEDVGEPGGYHGPAELGELVPGEQFELERQRRVGAVRGADRGGVVVVDPERVQRGGDDLQVAVAYRQVVAVGVAAPVQGVGEQPVVQGVVRLAGGAGFVGVADDVDGGVVVHDGDRCAGTGA